MSAINEVYGPLVEAARMNAPNGPQLLQQLGEKLRQANADRCRSVEDGVEIARRNLALYAQFYPYPVCELVGVYYGLATPSKHA